MGDQRLRDAILRTDFSSFTAKCFSTLCPGDVFLPNWHVDKLAWHLQQALASATPRLIVNLPPRSLKSITVSAAFPAFALGHRPESRIICVSYSDELARKHARDCRVVLEAPWYHPLFPRTRIDLRKNTEGEIATTQRGFRLATSIGGTLTGRGGDILIIDDPLKPAEAMSESERRRVNEWYDTTLLSRLDDKAHGLIIVVMQRLHEDDLTGHLLAKGGFELVSLAAIAEEDERHQIGADEYHVRRKGEALHSERESVETLIALKRSIGSLVFSAQYQQAPIPFEGNLFKKAWLRRYAHAPTRESFRQIVISWDTATKVGQSHDYSVGTVWGIKGNDFYLLDVYRERWEFPDLERVVRTTADHWKADGVVIEDANSGSALIQSLKQQSRLSVIAIKTKLDKVARASQQSATIEAGRVHVPAEAAWLAELERELLGFPNARYDDQVDSLVQFLAWAREREAYQPPLVIPEGLGLPVWRMEQESALPARAVLGLF